MISPKLTEAEKIEAHIDAELCIWDQLEPLEIQYEYHPELIIGLVRRYAQVGWACEYFRPGKITFHAPSG